MADSRTVAWNRLLDVFRHRPQTKSEHTSWRMRLETAIQSVTAAERAPIDRALALHEVTEGADGSRYCGLCSNHGDTNWPCVTVQALDTETSTTDTKEKK